MPTPPDQHVVPIDDLQLHRSVDCACEPAVRVAGGGMMFVHNAWDHREIVEEAEKILSQENPGDHPN